MRTLREKIGSMLYERTALSRKPEELARQELAALRDDAEFTPIADRLEPYDLVAIQELRDEEVIQRTLRLLADRGHSFRKEKVSTQAQRR